MESTMPFFMQHTAAPLAFSQSTPSLPTSVPLRTVLTSSSVMVRLQLESQGF
jgi:hypothetical protein